MKPWWKQTWFGYFIAALIIGALMTDPQQSHPQFKSFSDKTVQAVKPAAEDDPGWNCATMGDHICGPGNSEDLPAGCYDNATLVIPWERLAPHQRVAGSSPCAGMAPSQEQESDKAYTAAQH